MPWASTRVMRGSVSVSMAHRWLNCLRRGCAHGRRSDPAKRVFDTLAGLRAGGERMKAVRDELRRVHRREHPLILQVGLVERNDRWNVAGGGTRVLAEIEELVVRLPTRSVGHIEHRMCSAQIARRDFLVRSATFNVPQQQVYLCAPELHRLAIDLHANRAVILGREERVHEALHETRFPCAVHADHAHFLLNHRTRSAPARAGCAWMTNDALRLSRA